MTGEAARGYNPIEELRLAKSLCTFSQTQFAMNAIDYIRPRLYRVWPGAAFTFWLFAAKTIGAQLPDPLGERALVNRTPVNSRAFQWIGDASTCGRFSCAPTVAAEIALPPISRVQLVLGGDGAHGYDSRFGEWLLDRRADLRYRTDRMSAWIGAARSEGRAVDPQSNASVNSRLESGVRFNWTNVAVAMSIGIGARAPRAPRDVGPRSMIIMVPDSVTEQPESDPADERRNTPPPWSLAEIHASWNLGKFALSTTVGRAVSPQAAPSVWGSVEAARLVARGTSVFLNAGTSPAPLMFGMIGTVRRSIDLGLRVNTAAFHSSGGRPGDESPVAPAFLVLRAGEGQYRLRIRVLNADRVELASDCTAWQPVVMSRIADTLWESILPAAAGSHLVNIRINGGSWIVPPGLVPKSDDFAGSVGVFVVE